MNFPTQKLFLYIIPIIVIVGAFVFWRNSSESSAEVASLSVIANESALIDSDVNAGGKFANWQEALSSGTKIENSKQSTIATSENKTEALGGALFSEYITLKQSGQVNPEAINQLASRLSSDVASIEESPLYTSKDIVVSNDSSVDAQVRYANTVATIREKYRSEFAQKIGSATFTSPADANFQTTMVFASELYNSQAKELLKVSVPKPLSEIHLRLVNSYAGSGAGLEKMKLLDSDPTQSALGIKQFDSDSKNEEVILQELRLSLTASGILITPNDSAFSLWN